MKKHLLSLIVFGVLGGLFLAGISWSQNANRSTTKTGIRSTNAAGTVVPFSDVIYHTLVDERAVPAQSEIEQLMTQLREADDDAKKADLTKKLEAAVVTNFDEDMKSRETELTKLEERLTKLRAQLDRRRKAKPEIIQLQIKVMVNEADGLGFSGVSAIKAGPFGGASTFWPTRLSRFGGLPPENSNGPTSATAK